MENTRKYRYIRGIASLLFGCAICLFWGLYYPHHLHYHEQFQLFLFTPEYGIDKCLHPGGIAEYIAEFLTQFYYFAWAGATILAIVLVLIQRQINWLAKQMGTSDFWYPFSFLPSILLWVFLCDENALLAFPVSITLALFASSHPAKNRSSMGTNNLYAPNDAGALLGRRWWGLFHLRDRSSNRALHQTRASRIQQILYMDSYLHLAWNPMPPIGTKPYAISIA